MIISNHDYMYYYNIVCMYVCMYVWMDGWMDECMYGCVCVYIYIYIYTYTAMTSAVGYSSKGGAVGGGCSGLG